MVFFYQGPLAAYKMLHIVNRRFGHVLRPATVVEKVAPKEVDPFDITRSSNTHQAHTVVGSRIGSMFTPQRPALLLLNNIIGGPGMNSLLNVNLRERHGYVYTVDSAMSLFSDCGLFTVYFGCDPSNTARCRQLVERTLHGMAETPMSIRALDAAKKQFIGQINVAGDNFEQTAIGAGRATLFRGRVSSVSETRDAINAVTTEQLRTAAESLFPLSTLTLTS
jgi:predicted Zn-dependent peptidase